MEPESNKIVSIVVVTMGKGNYLKGCLDSIKEQTPANPEIIVIDNSLNPDFSQGINRAYPNVKLYSSPENLFYCQALNKGIEMSRGDFILCLNDDVILDEGFIEEAMRAFFLDDRIGMVSGKILRSNKATIDSAGLLLTLWRTARERGYGKKDKGQFDKEEYVFGVNGAVAFYSRKMLEDIKENNDYFDPDFHIFYEDLDIAWRARRCGWKGYYVPDAVSYHIRGATVRKARGQDKTLARRYLSDELHLDLVKNRYLCIIKNESFLGFLLHFPFIVSYDFFAWSYILLFKPKIFKNFVLNIKYFNKALKKRHFQPFSRR
jgi:GT2 family glycosyltransferase